MNRYTEIAKKVAAGRTPYHNVIYPILQILKRTDIDPRHVEAYLRLESPTLDSWSREKFRRTIPAVIQVIDKNPRQAEELADSYGL
jgi:hypothetical protein